ncbi:hypothetical protein M3Y97_01164600 [Aphelenchoides bicaudatus]|nr:hypothetical protein M3Y97_01164600 [Aphelenchoides bicaudatus]
MLRFILLFIFIISVNARKCYFCMDVEECAKDNNEWTIMQCGSIGSCTSVFNGQMKAIARGCNLQYDDPMAFSSGCLETLQGAKWCTCNSNLCNDRNLVAEYNSTLNS